MPPKVKEYMSSPAISLMPSDNLAHARNFLLRHKVGRLLVVDGDKLVGIITSTDFLKIFAYPELARKAWDELVVRDIMTPNPMTVEPNNSIEDAARIMYKYNIGSLPVVDEEGILHGIITRTDITRAYAEHYAGKATVGEVMDNEPPTVTPYHSINHVMEKIEEKPYYKVIVVEGEKPAGVIAKRDIVFLDPRKMSLETKYIKRNQPLPKGRTGSVRYYLIPLAADIMTPNPLVTVEVEDLAEAAAKMIEEKIGCLPVVDGDEGRLVGIVTKHEIIRIIAGFR